MSMLYKNNYYKTCLHYSVDIIDKVTYKYIMHVQYV
jgi:hypothetical protein